MNEINTMKSDRSWTWRDRLRMKLYPPDYAITPDAPPAHKDVLISHCFGEISMLDRIRILISGRVKVESRTVTENIIGACVSNTKIYALPPRWADPDYKPIPAVKG